MFGSLKAWGKWPMSPHSRSDPSFPTHWEEKELLISCVNSTEHHMEKKSEFPWPAGKRLPAARGLGGQPAPQQPLSPFSLQFPSPPAFSRSENRLWEGKGVLPGN